MRYNKILGSFFIILSIVLSIPNYKFSGAFIGNIHYMGVMTFLPLIVLVVGFFLFFMGGLEKLFRGSSVFAPLATTAMNVIAADKILELRDYLAGLDLSDSSQNAAIAAAGAGLYFLNRKKVLSTISKGASKILDIPKNKVMPYVKALVLSGALTYGAVEIAPQVRNIINDVRGSPKELVINPSDIDVSEKSVRGKFVRAYRWDGTFDSMEEKYNIPKGLLAGLAMRESYGDPLRLNESGDGGAGLFMFQPGTAKQYGLKIVGSSKKTGRDKKHGQKLKQIVRENSYDYNKLSKIDERFDVNKSTEAAAKYLKNLYKRYGDWDKALSAYNHGTPAKNPRSTNHVKFTRKYQDYYNKNDKN